MADRLAGPAPAPVTVRAYGTRYLRITVRRHDDGRFTWLRTPGPDHPGSGPLPGAAVRDLLDRAGHHPGGAGLVLGRPEPPAPRPAPDAPEAPDAPDATDPPGPSSGVLYDVPAPFSAAVLLQSGEEAARQAVADALRAAGRTLRRLHRERTPLPEPLPPHRGLARLRSWTAGEPRPGDAVRLRDGVRARLGPRLWTRLADWAHAPAPVASRRLLHGAPSLGWLVPTPRCGGAVLLTGEEVTVGEPAGDLGWLLGELAELRGAAARGLGGAARHRPGDFTEPARALLEGYLGPGPHPVPPEGTARHATLRLATHMHDYAAYVGWHDDLTAYADLLAKFLDAHGEPALHW